MIYFIIKNLSFNKIDIFHKKYENLFYTYFQNYLVVNKRKLNFRSLNNKIFNQIDRKYSFNKILIENKNNLPNSLLRKSVNDIKKILVTANRFGMGSQDPKLTVLLKLKDY